MSENQKKRSHPKKINTMVGNLFAKWQGQIKNRELLYYSLWVEIVGERVAKHTKVDQIKNKKLIVLAESAVWMNELTFLKENIKIKAKKLLLTRGIQIDEIIFKLG
jgi:hypothetical protein